MIRLAERSDVVAVNEIRRQVNEVHVNGRPDIFRPGFCQELQDAIYECFEDEEQDLIVAERDGIICGFASVEYIVKPNSPYNLERKFYRIAEFGVDEKCRRQGVATEMFQYIKEVAKQKGYNKVELDMWEFNDGALQFYEAMGFRTYRRYMEFDVE